MAANRLTWLGHTTFKLDLTNGASVLIDAWTHQNPACPDHYKRLDRVDAMLLTSGRVDVFADAVTLARQFRCEVVATYEITDWLSRKDVENLHGMGKGGTIECQGMTVSMVSADASSPILEDDGRLVYGGAACGYVVALPNGPTIYFAGVTNLFGDMKLIADVYRPDIAVLPIGDHFAMGPALAARAVEMLGVQLVIPMMYGTYPLLTGTTTAFREACAKHDVSAEIIDLDPGVPFPL